MNNCFVVIQHSDLLPWKWNLPTTRWRVTEIKGIFSSEQIYWIVFPPIYKTKAGSALKSCHKNVKTFFICLRRGFSCPQELFWEEFFKTIWGPCLLKVTFNFLYQAHQICYFLSKSPNIETIPSWKASRGIRKSFINFILVCFVSLNVETMHDLKSTELRHEVLLTFSEFMNWTVMSQNCLKTRQT